MTDVPAVSVAAEPTSKHRDVKIPAVKERKTFPDIQDHQNRTAIEALASRGIISGRDNGNFDPDATMTRAEFAAITVRALGLTPQNDGKFSDVKQTDWFAASVGTAAKYGIITGRGGGKFVPNDTISRQEAAVLVARAAKLCGMDINSYQGSDALSRFSDGKAVPDWARRELVFCAAAGILDSSATELKGTQLVCRGEIAQMLYQMLSGAELL